MRVSTGERCVELLQVVAPVLVLDVNRPARVILLELRVGRRDDVRPAGLRVDLEPYGQLVCLCMTHTCARSRRDDSERYGSDCRNENSRSHPRLPEPSTRDLDADPLWPAGVRARVSTPIGLYQLATPGLSHTGPVLVKGGQLWGRLSSVTIRYRSPR